MKRAKEVVEKWNSAANARYAKELGEMVEVITEFLYAKASEGQSVIPQVEVTEFEVKDRTGVFKYTFKTDNERHTYSTNQNLFFAAMKALGYNVKKTIAFTYVITPDFFC